MEEMMALRAYVRGGAENLRYERAPRPIPQPGEALVKVDTAGITFAELVWDETWNRNGVDRTPTIPAHEFAGRIVDPGSTDLHTGDSVWGLVPFDRDGAAAEYVAVPADFLGAKPDGLDDVTAAAAPLAGLTAWQALAVHAGCQPGDTVLVHGAAGSVGSLVTQLAAAMGAQVTATARAADAELVRSLGARRVIDYQNERFDDDPTRYDIVVDMVGGDTLDRSYAVVHPGGHLVTLQAPPSQEAAARCGITAIFFVVTPDQQQLTELGTMITDGRLRISVSETYSLAQGRDAYLSGARPGREPGKTVLTIQQ